MLASVFQCVPLILDEAKFHSSPLKKTTLEADGIRLEIQSCGDWFLPQGILCWVFLMVGGSPWSFNIPRAIFSRILCITWCFSLLSQRADLFIDQESLDRKTPEAFQDGEFPSPRKDLLIFQDNKDRISFQKGGWAGRLAVPYKTEGFLHLAFLSCHTNLCVWCLPGSALHCLPGDSGGKGSWCKALILCLWWEVRNKLFKSSWAFFLLSQTYESSEWGKTGPWC